MSIEFAPPVRNEKGEVVPGLFSFDVLERDVAVEKDIAKYLAEQNLREKFQQIENSK